MTCSAVILSYRRNFDLCEIIATRERPKEKEKERKNKNISSTLVVPAFVRFFSALSERWSGFQC